MRPVFVLAASAVVGAGCMQDFGIFDPVGQDGAIDVLTEAPPGDASPQPDGGALDGPIDAINDVAPDVLQDAPFDAPVEAGCNPAACPGYRCTVGVCDDYASCSEMHTQSPSIPSGAYEMKPGDASIYTAYCDMTTAGGGFTLVARSVSAQSAASFGWGSPTGSVSDDTKPYSLGVLGIGLSFTQLLVGNYASGKTWNPTVYVLTVPQSLSGCATSACATSAVTAIAGGCATAPPKLAEVGFTSQAAQFFFDGTTTLTSNGLLPAGFSLPGSPPCSNGGKLDATQGMIFVR